MTTTIFTGIDTAVTMAGAARKGGRHVGAEDLSLVHDAVMVTQNGKIIWLGPKSDWSRSGLGLIQSANRSVIKDKAEVNTIDFGGATIMPGFVECHTHTVFAGSRAEEFEWRLQGKTYQEIALAGGGIHSTMRATREASEEVLLGLAQSRVDHFLRQGVTTLEIKSGYGLNPEHELRLLQVAQKLKGPRMVRTFLGPHALSPEQPDPKDYLEQLIEICLPRLREENLAQRVDIFIEKNYFTAEQGQKYFAAANKFGLGITAHVEQLSHSGGTQSALAARAQSVDHVIEITADEVRQLAGTDTVAVLLPGADVYLKMKFPPARALIDAGACVALATDFNPGTCPTQDLSWVGLLARLELRMTLPEIIAAYTVGAAQALGLSHETGSLVQGKNCDFIVLDGSINDLFYSIGKNPVQSTWLGGVKKI